MKRRDFLKGMLVACAAPAIVRAEIIMPVKSIVLPEEISDNDYLVIMHPDVVDDLKSMGWKSWHVSAELNKTWAGKIGVIESCYE